MNTLEKLRLKLEENGSILKMHGSGTWNIGKPGYAVYEAEGTNFDQLQCYAEGIDAIELGVHAIWKYITKNKDGAIGVHASKPWIEGDCWVSEEAGEIVTDVIPERKFDKMNSGRWDKSLHIIKHTQ